MLGSLGLRCLGVDKRSQLRKNPHKRTTTDFSSEGLKSPVCSHHLCNARLAYCRSHRPLSIQPLFFFASRTSKRSAPRDPRHPRWRGCARLWEPTRASPIKMGIFATVIARRERRIKREDDGGLVARWHDWGGGGGGARDDYVGGGGGRVSLDDYVEVVEMAMMAVSVLVDVVVKKEEGSLADSEIFAIESPAVVSSRKVLPALLTVDSWPCSFDADPSTAWEVMAAR